MDRNTTLIRLARPHVPQALWKVIVSLYYVFLNAYFRHIGRPRRPGETSKAKQRRIAESFFTTYCCGEGLDVGYGGDLLAENCKGRDAEFGDAQCLKDIADGAFDFVYSSHTLEHIEEPDAALREWGRVVKAGGFLILYVPHRDLYEKKKTLPSRWNNTHKHFFLPEEDEAPDTIGLAPLLKRALPDFEIVYVKECAQNHTVTDPQRHSDGEYSIELVARKGLSQYSEQSPSLSCGPGL